MFWDVRVNDGKLEPQSVMCRDIHNRSTFVCEARDQKVMKDSGDLAKARRLRDSSVTETRRGLFALVVVSAWRLKSDLFRFSSFDFSKLSTITILQHMFCQGRRFLILLATYSVQGCVLHAFREELISPLPQNLHKMQTNLVPILKGKMKYKERATIPPTPGVLPTKPFSCTNIYKAPHRVQ